MRLTIGDMHAAAKRFSGRCLSTAYVNNSTHLNWECSAGHQWRAIPMTVRKGHWCPVCASKKRAMTALLSDGLQRCEEIASKNGGLCLSDEYCGNSTPLEFECASGHRWSARPSNLFQGKWCPICAGKKFEDPIAKLAGIALQRGGRLLSGAYKSGHIPLLWECKKGHRWMASPSSIKSGSWCPHCAGFKSRDEWYRLMVEVAEKRSGKLLTARADFRDPRSPTAIFSCTKGHEWRSSAYNIVTNGSWCKRCGLSSPKTLLSLADMHLLAAKRDLKCLSTEYKGAHEHIEWECSRGHRWHAKPTNISSGRGCPECKKETLSERFRRKGSLAFFGKIAEDRGGSLLSTDEPKNSNEVLFWECARGHRWRAKASNVQNGKWCPECSGGRGERICRAYFEDLFGQPFPSMWPDWLVISGSRRQLDGYCDSLKLAFEHQGEQHYRDLGSVFRSKHSLAARQKVDEMKEELCRNRGVLLIQIPEVPRLTPIEKLRGLIKTKCVDAGISVPSDFDSRSINLKRAWNHDLMERLHIAAEKQGGKCISGDFLGVSQKHTWECAKGHSWEATASSILHRKSWCPRCHHARLKARIHEGHYKPRGKEINPLDIQKLQAAARLKSGELLSSAYEGMSKKHLWRCEKGHKWEATGSSIIHQKSWCPKCARARFKIG
jgi:hypothetical protein